jgi:6-phosphogluconolactonase
VRVTTVADAEAVAARAADVVERLIGAGEAEGAFHLALAGGSTPERCHELLAERDIDWSRVHIWLSDERAVPPDDEESNFLMIRRSLLDRIEIPEANVHRVLGELGADAAADAYEAELRDAGPLDLVMCGMGPDGHTMSLFPGRPELEVEDRLVVAVHDAPKPPPDRVTFTLPVIREAGHTMLLVAGEGKAEALAKVLEGSNRDVPASLLRVGRLEIIADDAAAPGDHKPG